MLTETKLKHAAIVIDGLDYSLGAAIVEYAADCGLEVFDFYYGHCEENLSSRGAERRGDPFNGLLRFARNDGCDDIKVNFIDNSGVEPARARLVSKIQALTKQDLDYESFIEALVPNPPDLIIVVGDKLASRVIEEASYAELVFVDKPELDSIKAAFAEFARRKRNFGI